jgi:hypothetical protein
MSYSLFSPQGFLKGYQRHKFSSKLYMSFSPEKGFFLIVYNGAIINMCYNFLLLFPSSFKEFLVAYTPVFFSCFYSTGIFEGTIPFIDLKDRFDREGVLEISQRVILTDSSYTPSVISPRPRRGEVLPVKTASLTGCSPLPRTCVVVM